MSLDPWEAQAHCNSALMRVLQSPFAVSYSIGRGFSTTQVRHAPRLVLPILNQNSRWQHSISENKCLSIYALVVVKLVFGGWAGILDACLRPLEGIKFNSTP